jgi:glutathione S-transferase
MAQPARLITIPFSHYCEKARWAADYTRFAYREDGYIPGAHMLPMRLAGGKTVPLLVTRDKTYTDSTDILTFLDSVAPADRKLYPLDPKARAEVEAFERICSQELGVATRLNAYFHGLADIPRLVKRVAPSLSGLQRVTMRAVMPLLGKLIRKKYRVSEKSAERAREIAANVFAMAGERLEKMPYLGGDRFGAADITFASLAALALAPPGHPSFDPDDATLAPEVRALVDEYRATRAGAHVMKLYREHRRA